MAMNGWDSKASISRVGWWLISTNPYIYIGVWSPYFFGDSDFLVNYVFPTLNTCTFEVSVGELLVNCFFGEAVKESLDFPLTDGGFREPPLSAFEVPRKRRSASCRTWTASTPSAPLPSPASLPSSVSCWRRCLGSWKNGVCKVLRPEAGMGHMRTMWNHHGIKSELLSTGGGLDSGDVAERTTFYLFLLLGFCWGSSSRRSSWLRASEQSYLYSWI